MFSSVSWVYSYTQFQFAQCSLLYEFKQTLYQALLPNASCNSTKDQQLESVAPIVSVLSCISSFDKCLGLLHEIPVILSYMEHVWPTIKCVRCPLGFKISKFSNYSIVRVHLCILHIALFVYCYIYLWKRIVIHFLRTWTKMFWFWYPTP